MLLGEVRAEHQVQHGAPQCWHLGTPLAPSPPRLVLVHPLGGLWGLSLGASPVLSGRPTRGLSGSQEPPPGLAHLLSGLCLVDDANDPLQGTLGLLPVDG